MSKDSAAVRDQLGNDPDITFYLNADYDETIVVEEQSTIIKTEELGNGWIVGTATNGIVGVNTGTVGGGQQIVGGSFGTAEIIIRIVNPNNTFSEHFNNTLFQDPNSHNTAVWDTTQFRLAMHTNNDHSRAYNTIATLSTIFLNVETVISATVNADETKWGDNDLIKYFLSANGGNDWEEVQRGINYFFKSQGQDLRVKIIFFGQGGAQTYIENLQVSYTV